MMRETYYMITKTGTSTYGSKSQKTFVYVRSLLSPQSSCFGLGTLRSSKINQILTKEIIQVVNKPFS